MSKISWILSTLLLCSSAPAFADNPYNNEQLSTRDAVIEAGRSSTSILPLLRLWRGRHHADPNVTRQALETLSANRRLHPTTRHYARVLLSRAALERGDLDAANAATEELGYVTEWNLLGPFDNEGKAGFGRAFGVEEDLLNPPDSAASFEGRDRPVSWYPYEHRSPRGYINFDASMRPDTNVCSYAQTVIQSDRARPLSLWVGAGGAIKVWWNGELVLVDERYRQPNPERSVAIVGAHRGANRVTVKVCVAQTAWGFYLRVGDPRGQPVRGVTVDHRDRTPSPLGHSRVRRPATPRSLLEDLSAAATADDAEPEDLENLARYLTYTGSDDPAEHRALQLAERAATIAPTVERILLVTELAGERSQITDWMNRGTALAPEDPRIRLLRAKVMLRSPSPEDEFVQLDIPNANAVTQLQIAELRARIYRHLDLHDAAYQVIADASANLDPNAHWLNLQAAYAGRAGHRDATIEAYRELLSLDFNRNSARRELIEDAVNRGEGPRAHALLEEIFALYSDSTRNLRYIARIRESIGDEAGAAAILANARALAPDDVSVLVAQGRFLLRAGSTGEAALALEQALRLRPQDAATRELLAQLRPDERPDEGLAVPAETLLARRVESSGYPLTLLQDLTVNTVYENGLGSSFRQLAAQVHDDEGARQWRTYQIQFDPGSQRVELRRARVYRSSGETLEAIQTFERQMGEPWYRIYYDTRSLVVVFPDLEAGDTVELQYRLDDVAHTNLFADYYGDLHLLQSYQPVSRIDYVLITPTERDFFFNEPELAGLQREERITDGQRIVHYWAEDIPAIRREDGMPGLTQIAPYLHVSTYRTWEDVGRWYWGLIRDQLYADENLVEVVHQLVEGAPDIETKVERIYDWVIRNTRYVGLEFGIHGFKPYRVPHVLRRGFGDCKDKASVLYTMLREAGIEAHIVLTRTRRNGAIGELPASLAVFDHAIAYVPAIDRYLDGTAENSGSREFPNMDQGVTVLHVWESGAELRETPILPPSENVRHRRMEVQLASDGSAETTIVESVLGASANLYRGRYQAPGTRVERMERELRRIFPGLTLEGLEFSDLDDLEAPIEYSYRARVPRFAEAEIGGLRLAPSVLGELTRRMARSPNREHDLDLGGTSTYVEERQVRLPAGMSITSLPESREIESRFGRLDLRISVEGSTLTIRTEFVLQQDRISSAEYEDFRTWVNTADQALRQRIELRGGAR